jgi:hypothetical protein
MLLELPNECQRGSIIMVRVSVHDATLKLELQGLSKLWALKSRFEIPLAHVRDVYTNVTAVRAWWESLHAPGSWPPKVFVPGTCCQEGKRVFWDVKNCEKTIVIEVRNERYEQLVIQVANPDAVVSLLSSVISKTGG